MVSQIASISIVCSFFLFRRRSNKTSKLRVTGLFVGNPPATDGFPPQRASYTENVSIRWRHHVLCWLMHCMGWITINRRLNKPMNCAFKMVSFLFISGNVITVPSSESRRSMCKVHDKLNINISMGDVLVLSVSHNLNQWLPSAWPFTH